MPDNLPGKGLFGWLGRQVGHLKRAVRTDVRKQAIVHRQQEVQEHPLPDNPQVKLRRTVIEEVIVEKPQQDGPQASGN